MVIFRVSNFQLMFIGNKLTSDKLRYEMQRTKANKYIRDILYYPRKDNTDLNKKENCKTELKGGINTYLNMLTIFDKVKRNIDTLIQFYGTYKQTLYCIDFTSIVLYT